MNENLLIALGSLVISLITMIIMLRGQRHTATTDYVLQLEERLKKAEERIKILEEHEEALMKENLMLLRQLAKNGAKV